MAEPTFGRGFGGSLGMEVGTGNLEGYGKYRPIWRPCWSWIFATNLKILE
jgi:hypothetical protein